MLGIGLALGLFTLRSQIMATATFESVANITLLGAIGDAALQDGSLAYTSSILAYWKLIKSSTRTADGITVVSTLSGSGRWVRQILPEPSYWTQAAWYVNPSTGNDENDGKTAGTALATLSEICRRVSAIPYINVGVTVTITGTVPATDNEIVSPMFGPSGSWTYSGTLPTSAETLGNASTTITVPGTLSVNAVSSSTTVAATGAVSGASLTANGVGALGTISANGAISGASVAVTGASSGATLAANGTGTTGTVSATGAITGNSVSATTSVAGATLAANGTGTTGTITATGQISGNSLSVTNAVGCGSVASSGAISGTTITATTSNVTSAISMPTIGSDIATVPLVITSQAPYPGSTAHKGTGAVVVNFPATTTAGESKGPFGALTLQYNGANTLSMGFEGYCGYLDFLGSNNTGIISVNGTECLQLHNTNWKTSLPTIIAAGLSAYSFTYEQATGTTPPTPASISITSQAPGTNSSGGTRTPGSITLVVPAPNNGGTTNGVIAFNIAGAEAARVTANGLILSTQTAPTLSTGKAALWFDGTHLYCQIYGGSAVQLA